MSFTNPILAIIVHLITLSDYFDYYKHIKSELPLLEIQGQSIQQQPSGNKSGIKLKKMDVLLSIFFNII